MGVAPDLGAEIDGGEDSRGVYPDVMEDVSPEWSDEMKGVVTIHPIFRSYHLPQQTRRHPVPNLSSPSPSPRHQNRPQYQ